MLRLLPSLVCAALAVTSAAAVAAVVQDDEVDLSRLETYIDKAINGSAYIRPQAAARLVPMGAAAADRLVELSAGGNETMAELGADLVEIMGAFGDERLRERLWDALADPDFPWRPAAVRALANNPLTRGPENETPQFHALLTDPIAPVRTAALGFFRRVFDEPVAGPRGAMRDVVAARLADPSDYVRRAAAVTLVGWGEDEALYWLLEDLRRTDSFFDSWTGKNAAYESRRALVELLGDTFGFDPEQPPTYPGNDQALKAIEASIAARMDGRARPVLPEVARASGPIDGAVLGLEVVSCRRGEHFLRWTTDDRLLVGMGNPATVPLPEGTTARLLALAKDETPRLASPFYGRPGCDMEKLRLVPTSGEAARSWFVSKGQARVDGLRPEPMGRVLRALVESIPEDIEAGGDERLVDLRQRARETMVAVGGE